MTELNLNTYVHAYIQCTYKPVTAFHVLNVQCSHEVRPCKGGSGAQGREREAAECCGGGQEERGGGSCCQRYVYVRAYDNI